MRGPSIVALTGVDEHPEAGPMPSDDPSRAAAERRADELRRLSRDRRTAVRMAVARNPHAPEDLLQVLVRDKAFGVRFAVAENLNPAAVPVALEAPDPDVRVILAQRLDLDPETYERLLIAERDVRVSLTESSQDPKILSRLAADEEQLVRASVSSNPALPTSDLETLARDRLARVRAVAAQSRRLSPETVLRLARDRSAVVRYFTLEQHPFIEVAELLVDDPDEEIARLAKTGVKRGRSIHSRR